MRKINYCSHIPKINWIPFLLENDSDQILDLFYTKSEAWQYEREWRIIHKKAGTLFTYEADALRAVYYGPDIESETMEIICLILGGQNPNIEYWKGIRSEREFKVTFEKFKYTTYLEAKALGLRK